MPIFCHVSVLFQLCSSVFIVDEQESDIMILVAIHKSTHEEICWKYTNFNFSSERAVLTNDESTLHSFSLTVHTFSDDRQLLAY